MSKQDVNNKESIYLVENNIIESLKTINNIHFTNREIDIIACLLGGKAYKKIASFLSISPKTVEMHTRNIMIKLGCNSRNHIIDFIEKSEKFMLIKQHYSNLLAREIFELELKKSLTITKNNITCLIFYHKKQRTKDLFIDKLEKYLNIAGIKTFSKIWEKNKSNNFLLDKIKTQQIDHIIYVMTDEFTEQLKEIQYDINEEACNLMHNIKKNSNSIIFLLINDTIEIINRKTPEFTCISLLELKNYYLFIFEIVKKLLPVNSIDVNIARFKKQHDIYVNYPSIQNLPQENKLINLTVNNKANSFFKEKVFLYSTIFLLVIGGVGLYTFNNLKYKTQTVLNNTDIEASNSYQYSDKPLKTWPLQLSLYENKRFVDRKINNINFIELFHKKLKSNDQQIKILAMYGLGGVGKTQLAYRYITSKLAKDSYSLRIWFPAETKASLNQSFLEFAKALNLVKIKNYDGSFDYIRDLVLNWFIQHPKWLIIFDNAIDHESIKAYLPKSGGSILITSRQAIWPINIIDTLNIKPMQEEEAVNLIQTFSGHKTDSDAKLTKMLGYLPLAIVQAASYMQVYDKTADEYLTLYKRCQQELLKKDLHAYGVEHEPVIVTWNNSLNVIEEAAKQKGEGLLVRTVLDMSAYLSSENIPKFILTQWIKKVEPNRDSEIVTDEVVAQLLSHSLINQEENKQNFSVHRLLQATIRSQNKQLGKEQDYIASNLDTLVQLFTKDTRSAKNFQITYSLLPHIDATLEYAKEYMNNKHIKLQVARLLNVKAYFYTQIGMTVIQNASMYSELAKQYYGSLANITENDFRSWLQGNENLEIRTKKCAQLLYKKLSTANLSTQDQELLPILYASTLYITGRMHFFKHNQGDVDYYKACLYLSKQISKLIERNTGKKVFYKILAARDGILCLNNFNVADQQELIKLSHSYRNLLHENGTYVNEDNKIQYLKTDQYHKLVCYKHLIQIYTQLIRRFQQNNCYEEAINYINELEKLISQKPALERVANYYNIMGDFYLVIGKNQKSINYFTKALNVEKLKNGGHGKIDYPLADAYYGLTKAYINLNDYKVARDNIYKCLQIREVLYENNDRLLLTAKDTKKYIETKLILTTNIFKKFFTNNGKNQ